MSTGGGEMCPSFFLEKGDVIRRYADEGLPKNFKTPMSAVVGAIYNPSSFFILPADFWILEHKVMSDMQRDYGAGMTVEREKQSRPLDYKDLEKGMYVAVMYEDEWHRGRVLDFNPEAEQPYSIRLIDFGEQVEASLDELRFLFRGCQGSYEPCVECQLVLPLSLDSHPRRGNVYRERYWQFCQIRAFHNIIFDRKLEVTILNRITNIFGETVWQVTINIPEQIGNPIAEDKMRRYGIEPDQDSPNRTRVHRKYTPADIDRELRNALHGFMNEMLEPDDTTST